MNLEPSSYHFCPRCIARTETRGLYGPMRGVDASNFLCKCEGGQGTQDYSAETKARFNPNEVVFTFLSLRIPTIATTRSD
jgi:hypothetical protein